MAAVSRLAPDPRRASAPRAIVGLALALLVALPLAGVQAAPGSGPAGPPVLQPGDLPPGFEPLPPGLHWYSEWFVPGAERMASSEFERRDGPGDAGRTATRLLGTIAWLESPARAWSALPWSLGHEFPAPDWLDPPGVGEESVLRALRDRDEDRPHGYELVFRVGRHLVRVLASGPDAGSELVTGAGRTLANRLADREPGALGFVPPPDPADAVTQAVSALRQLRPLGRVAWAPIDPARVELEQTPLTARVPRAPEAALLDLLGQTVPPDCAEQPSPQPGSGGYYLPGQNRLVLFAPDGRIGPQEQAVLAHEYLHALTDQHFNLQRLEGSSAQPVGTDRALAVQALIEGDAMLVAERYVDANLGPADQAIWRARNVERDVAELRCLPPLRRAQAWFPYRDGHRFVAALWAAGGWDLVDQAYRRPPTSSAQVLHPEQYLAGRLPLAVEPPPAPPGWELVWSDTFGELALRALVATFVDPARAEAAAAGWAGDRLALFEREDGAVALALASAWDDPGEAAELFTAAADALDARFGPSGRRVEASDWRVRWSTPELEALLVRVDRGVWLLIGPDAAFVEGARAPER